MWRRGAKCEQGASAVEFAIVVPLLTTLLLAIIGFGFLYNNYLAVTHAAQEGARMAAVGQYSESAVREAAYPVDPSSVTISYPDGNSRGNPVVVTVVHDYVLEIPFFGSSDIPLTGRAQMRLEVP